MTRRQTEVLTGAPAGVTAVNAFAGAAYGLGFIGLHSPLQPVMAAVGVSLIGLGRRLA